MSAAADHVHQAIVEAIASQDNPATQHGQLCPTWTRRLRPSPASLVWVCDCWRLPQIEALARVIWAALEREGL